MPALGLRALATRRPAVLLGVALPTLLAALLLSPVQVTWSTDEAEASAAHDVTAGEHEHDLDEGCPAELVMPSAPQGGPTSCAHADAPPPGVDVDKPVATAVLQQRKGGSPAAFKAAQADGVVTPVEFAATTDRVACDGNGSSGYRTQAIYVVSADKPNRYSSVSAQIKQWAAGVDDVFNRSAAKTGGVRNVRFVTSANGDGTCSPTVLNVTLPAGANNSFSSTIQAMHAQGFTDPARKYLMWVDATGYCGIAQTYLDSRPDQSNPNNGSYPQFARTDTACWGSSYSVEAHELSHTFGSVQNDAPHTTRAGHCYDESDRMCYADGGVAAMRSICPADQEPLLDCNNDDYYTTFEPAGSYLATHWNTADSRFLIGGGDGAGGGSTGEPTRLGGTITVNNPAVAGLATQVQASLELPSGRTATSTWTTTRKDCVFTAPTALASEVTCNATSTATAPVTFTAVDSAGEKIVRSTSMTFTPAARSSAATLTVDGTTGAYTACPTGKLLLGTRMTDAATGQPIKGLAVTFWRTPATGTAVRAGTGVTGPDGRATSAALAAVAGTYRTTSTATPGFPSVSSSTTAVTVSTTACTTALTMNVSDDTPVATVPVTVSGRMTRSGAGFSSVPAAGEAISLMFKPATAAASVKPVRIGSAVTAADGGYTAAVPFTVSGTLSAVSTGRVGFPLATATSRTITVTPWTTALTASASPGAVMATSSVTVSGTARRTDGSGTDQPMVGATVAVVHPIAGGRTATVNAKTTATGTWSVVIKPTAGGTITARYAGVPGQLASSATTNLTVTPWTTTMTTVASAGTVMAANPVTVSGVVRKSDGTTATPLAAAAVTITYPLAGGKTAVVKAKTSTTGTYAVVVKPTGSGSIVAAYVPLAGYTGSTASAALTVTPWSTTTTAARSTSSPQGPVTAGTSIATTGRVTRTGGGVTTPVSGASVRVTYPMSGGRTGTVTVRTNSTGTWTALVKPTASGQLTATLVPPVGYNASAATPLGVTVT